MTICHKNTSFIGCCTRTGVSAVWIFRSIPTRQPKCCLHPTALKSYIWCVLILLLCRVFDFLTFNSEKNIFYALSLGLLNSLSHIYANKRNETLSSRRINCF